MLSWREVGPPNHHDDKVDSEQKVVNKELSLSDACWGGGPRPAGRLGGLGLGLGCGVWCLVFGVWSLRFKVWGLCLGFGFRGFEFRVEG